MRTRFSSISDYEDQPCVETMIETDAVTLDDLVRTFEDFLKASGFGFPNNAHLDFVYDDEDETIH